MNSDALVIIITVGYLVSGVLAWMSLRVARKTVRYLLKINEGLLTALALKTQGDEQEHYRKLRATIQKLLETA